MISVSDVLKQTQQPRTQHIFTVSKLQKQWKDIVGEFLATQTSPKKIFRNVLWISVEHSALTYELSMMKDKILERIQEIPGIVKGALKDVKFVHEDLVHRAEQAFEYSRKKFERAKVEENDTLDSILQRIRELSVQLRK